MKRQGKVFEILGKAARSANFSIEAGKFPDVTQKAYAAGRDALKAARQEQKQLAATLAKLRGDRDLNADARDRKVREAHEVARAAIAGPCEEFRKVLKETQIAVTERIRLVQRGEDPLAPVKIDWEKLSTSDREIAKLHRASSAQTALLVRGLARQEVDTALSHALSDASGVALTGAYARALAAEDSVLLACWEGYGRDRVEREGRQVHRALLAEQIESARDARLGDDEHLLLDHLDALETMSLFVEQVATEVTVDSFAERSVSLAQAPQMLGDELAGVK